jgi:hypothetical protein
MWDFTVMEEKKYLEGVHDSLKVQVISVKHNFKNKNLKGEESPYSLVTFKVLEGDNKDDVLNERFYCSAKFKMAWLAIACGIFELDEKGAKVLPSTFTDPVSLVKRELYISTKNQVYNGKEYCQLNQMSSEPIEAFTSDPIGGW